MLDRIDDPRNLVAAHEALRRRFNIVVVKNKYKFPTPMGYSDLNLVVEVTLGDGSTFRLIGLCNLAA